MTVEFRKSFERDIKKIKDKQIKERILQVIDEVEQAQDINEISNIKKLSGYDNFYRIRIKDYRIGLYVEDDVITFVRCLHRRDIYKYFP